MKEAAMTDTQTIKSEMRAFAQTYDYDMGYLESLVDTSPGAYDAFAAGMGMSLYRKALPLDAHFVARVATMQGEDCGPCAQLTLKMAVEAGVDRDLLALLIAQPERLPAPLRDVHGHALAVTRETFPDPERAARIRTHYGDEAFAELAVSITGSRLYPTLKRALLKSSHCERLSLDF
ncbi:MAG: hypothetical protein ACE5FN_07850 [Leptospirillia bacterium]